MTSFILDAECLLILENIKNKSKFVRTAIKNMGNGLPTNLAIVNMLDKNIVTVEELNKFNKYLTRLVEMRGG
jgi:hypothetical protein